MRIYVAGSSKELERVKACSAELEIAGHEVVSTWWRDVEVEGCGNPTLLEKRIHFAQKDLSEIDRCGVLWLLVPVEGVSSHGAFLEYGYALAKSKILISSGAQCRSIFLSLRLEFSTDHEVLVTYFGKERNSGE